MNIFAEIKNELDIIDIAEKYGINVINGTNALCPFHNDHNPSMSFKGDICTCWVCNETFDCIGLVAKLFNLTPIESAKKISRDFSLGLEFGQPIGKEHIKQTERENELLERFDKWEKDTFLTLTDYFHLLIDWSKSYAPSLEEFTNGIIDTRYIEACHNIDYIDYLIDILIYGEYKDKVNFYKTHRKEIEKIGNKIRKIKNIRKS